MFGLVDSFRQMEFVISPFGFFPGSREAASSFLYILFPEDMVVKPVDRLSLVSGWFKTARVKTGCVVRTARSPLVWTVQQSSRPSPALV
jgi:hypothetical protein